MNNKLYNIVVPHTYMRGYIQVATALSLMVLLFMVSLNSIESKLSHQTIGGEISDIKVSTTSGGAGKYSGGAVTYHIQLKNHKRVFMLDDASVFTNWQFDEDDFEVGDMISFKIKKEDIENLNAPTKYSERGPRHIMFPEEDSSITAYGLKVNGVEILSTASSIRGFVYNRWFWILLPLLFYSLYCLSVFTNLFKFWTKRAEDRYYAKKKLNLNKSF